MRYVLAVIGGLFTFAGTFIAAGLVLCLTVRPLNDVQIYFGLLSVNLTVVAAVLLATIAATYAFKASLAA